MNDWLIELERLKSLLDLGAITQAEFDIQKARLLSSRIDVEMPGTQFETEGDVDDAEIRQRTSRRLLVLCGISAFGLVIATYFFWPDSSDIRNASQSAYASHPTEIAGDPAVAPSSAIEPDPIDLTASLQFSSPAQCTAADALDRVYDKLDTAMENGASGLSIKLDAFPSGLPLRASKSTDAEGIHTARAEVRFPEHTMWHGLRLSRITTEIYAPPDTDSSYSRILTFFDTPEQVQRTFNDMGVPVELDPGFSELSEPDGSGCGGSMQIVAIAGGAALSCGWGC